MAQRDDPSFDADPATPAVAVRASISRRQFVVWLLVVTIAIATALLVREFAVQQFRVEGDSMVITLHDGDRVLVDKLSYRVLRAATRRRHRDAMWRVTGAARPNRQRQYRPHLTMLNTCGSAVC